MHDLHNANAINISALIWKQLTLLNQRTGDFPKSQTGNTLPMGNGKTMFKANKQAFCTSSSVNFKSTLATILPNIMAKCLL